MLNKKTSHIKSNVSKRFFASNKCEVIIIAHEDAKLNGKSTFLNWKMSFFEDLNCQRFLSREKMLLKVSRKLQKSVSAKEYKQFADVAGTTCVRCNFDELTSKQLKVHLNVIESSLMKRCLI